MNALAHCVEAAWSPCSARPRPRPSPSPAPGRSTTRCRASSTIPSDLEARTDLLAGAALAGRALQNATMGVHHGLSQQLGGRTGIPHGLANALVLPARDAVQRRRPCPRPWRRSPTRSAAGRRRPRSRCCDERAGLPSRLRDVGVSEDDLDAVARLSQGNPTVARNPRPVSEEDARAILAAAY